MTKAKVESGITHQRTAAATEQEQAEKSAYVNESPKTPTAEELVARLYENRQVRDPGASWSHFSISSATGMPSANLINDGTEFLLGVDEAGRGPVLGPMVYAVAFAPVSQKSLIKNIGVDDSKKLSELDRERLFLKMMTTECKNWLGFAVTAISPRDISNGMLRRSKYNLNQQAYDTTIALIRETLNKGVNITEIYVDTVGKEKPYQEILQSHFPGINITVTTKADSKFPIVSAASIFAKVVRDTSMKNWSFCEPGIPEKPFTRIFGSGYPGDPNTRKWLRKNMDPVFGFPDITRFSWSTCSKELQRLAANVTWPDDEEEETKDGNISNYFQKASNTRPAKKTAPKQDISDEEQDGSDSEMDEMNAVEDQDEESEDEVLMSKKTRGSSSSKVTKKSTEKSSPTKLLTGSKRKRAAAKANNNHEPDEDPEFLLNKITRKKEKSFLVDTNRDPVFRGYRHLEDPDALETKAFVEAQKELFEGFIGSSSVRAKLTERLTKVYNYERYGTPFKKGDNYYYFYNSGLQPQSVLYTQKTIDGEASVFFDPNTLSADGTISLGTYSFSESGNLFGYALSESGSDWVKIHVRKVGDDKDLEEKPLEWAKFTGIEFTHDEKGFFYTRFAAPSVNHDKAGTETDKAKNQLLCYHRIGTSQDQDIIVYNDDANPERMFWIQVSDCGRYLILAIRRSTEPKNLVYFADLEKQFGSNSVLDVPEFTEIIGEWSAGYSFIGNVGNVFYFETSFDAPKKRIVKYVLPTKVILTKTTTTKTVTVKNGNSTKTTKTESVSELIEPVKAVFEEVIGEADTAIDFLRIVDIDKLILVYLKDVKHVVKVYNLKTGAFLNDIAIPEGSIINGISGSKKSPELFYSYSSYIAPTTIRRYEFAADSSDTLFKQVVVPGISTDIFEVKQVFYTSEDGTKIPMYIFYKKGTVLDGENPTLLYAYGGFSISILPSFNIQYLTFIEKFNGVVAVANIRGGGEYGKAWHDAGKLFNKQNCYTDFQYAARYLISEKYTKPAKLTINGGSNGGLLIGTCLNQTPELFGLGIAEVGVMDLLRFHKFTIGGAWVADFGNPDVKEEFENAKKISPLHNVDGSKTYPAVLLTTGDHDDRVVPLHSMKLAATLQHELNENPNPIMMRVNTKAGHGAGKSIQQTIEEAADKYTFLSIVLNAPYFE
ncbi:hypothetical protein HK100_002331 [Physocladia obscura]|uniref:Ribonuclease n=1 Tax=Physocladia obscura TaxID=109957 RepID=A0AAD5XLF3_9FUNG|nr:hypothetical protein HK100_002331 [Physocladia obscura]